MLGLGAPNCQHLQPNGLTGDEAHRRLEKFGPNVMPDTAFHPLRMALEKFWAPVPWMLEAAIVLQVALGDYAEAAIIAGLLVFNAALGLFQESRAQTTLEGMLEQYVAYDGTPCRNTNPAATRGSSADASSVSGLRATAANNA
jgi:magnesium-transporting ATPase (P-type)